MSNTVKANLDHCYRLADECGCRLDAESVASYITDIAEGKSREELSSPFPEVLHDRLHGEFQPKYLMLKLACVLDDDAAINYELFKSRRLCTHPRTDNAENGTYWPLWLPGPGYNDLRKEIDYLRKIYLHFVESLRELRLVYDRFDEFIVQPYDAGGKM